MNAQEFWQHFFQSKAETERPESTRRAPSRATTTFPPPTTVKERASPPPTIILPIAEDENLSSSEERNPSLLLPVLPEAPLAWTVRQPPTAVIRPTTTTSHSPNRISTWSYVDGPANASGVIVSSEKPLSTSATESKNHHCENHYFKTNYCNNDHSENHHCENHYFKTHYWKTHYCKNHYCKNHCWNTQYYKNHYRKDYYCKTQYC
ncbi:unnamed protein product [Darwinula stevensoni]|uniref:Uncharacterized protein n=1 Tax=Darwinula stevensoni TaxID=69355 RepID=A0A7R8X7M9_9CRUS|nr:unnamed protein product [Darwinula stevensoni]CAG0887078.1 unnamed protein product [Darwinula stevensoni]